MKKLFIVFTIIFLSTILSAFPINLELAERAAHLKINIEEMNNFSIEKVDDLYSDNTLSAYIFHLHPRGFIIVSSNTDIEPIIGYSFRNNFSMEDAPANIALSMIKTDLELRMKALPFTDPAVVSENNLLWENYIAGDYRVSDSRESIWPPNGYSSTGGWIEVLWTLYHPYWDFCPLDPETGQRCNTSCMTTAVTQIMQYHHYIGDPIFTDEDDYYSDYTTPNIHIDDDHDLYDFPSFSELNVFVNDLKANIESYTPLTDNDKAAISFAFGIAAKVDYCSSHGSGATPTDARNALVTKFGYDSANLVMNTNATFYTDLITNMMEARPALLGIFDSESRGGHAIVCDGYNASDDTYHLNMGWGGSCNGWYSLPDGMPSGYTIVSLAIMNIEGGSVPFDIDGQIVAAGAPLENTIVTLDGPRNYQCVVGNSTGEFTIEFVVEGNYTATAIIELADGGYYYTTQDVYLDSVNNNIVLSLDNYETLTAQVNAPIDPGGCHVAVYQDEQIVSTGVADAFGNVVMTGVLPGVYFVTASLDSSYFGACDFEVTAHNQNILCNVEEYPYDHIINFAGEQVGQLQLSEEMICGIKLAGEDIADFGNDAIGEVNFIAPFDPSAGQIFVQVWHENNLISEKEVLDFAEGQWSSTVLDNFALIDPDEVYYAGYKIISSSGAVPAVYYDAGPRVEGKGAFIKSNDWIALPQQYDYNFCINAVIISKTPLEVEENNIPTCVCNLDNYPNPFNPTTTISFSIPKESKIEIAIFDLKGRKIKQLVNNKFAEGQHSVIWNSADDTGKKVASGIYFYKLSVNGKTEVVKKCLCLK